MSDTDGLITVVITTVGQPRAAMLARALQSVRDQTRQPAFISLAIDDQRQGAAVNRQRGTDRVNTEFVAYLDDDDEFYSHHVAVLGREMVKTGADLVYPWFDVIGGVDPFPTAEGLPWDDEHPRQIPVTFIARTAAIREVGGWIPVLEGAEHEDGNRAGEDWDLTLRLVAGGKRIHHIGMRTWKWYHHSSNSMGLPNRVKWGDYARTAR